MGLRVWLSRGLIAVVVLWNLQCAAMFLIQPDQYAPAYELEGAPGTAAVQGMGILFVMWNIPYLVALSDPARRRISLLEALAMQTVGVIGESLLLAGLPEGHTLLRASIQRFILFDGIGVALLVLAAAAVVPVWREQRSSQNLVQPV